MKQNKKDFKKIIFAQNKLKQALKLNNQKPIILETFAQSNKNIHLKNKHRNKSMSEKKILKIQENRLLSNTILEVDYLNFSQMNIEDKFLKLSNSFSQLEYEYNKRINNRYEDCESPLDTIRIEKEIEKKNNEELNKTPSTVCNYYTNSDLNSPLKNMNEDNYVRKNLNLIYNQMNNSKKEINSKIKNKNQKIMNKKQQNKEMMFIKVNKKKLDDQPNKIINNNTNNIKKNNSRQKVKNDKKEETQKNNYTNTNFYHGKTLFNNYINSPLINKKNQKNNVLISGKPKNKMLKCRTASMDGLKYNSKTNSNSMYNNNNNSTIKINKNNSSNHNLVYINNTDKRKKRLSQQKPIMLCFDQMKYENYFVTPTNNKTLENKKSLLTNNKSHQNILNNYVNNAKNKSASIIKVQNKCHNKSASVYNINKSNKNIYEKKMKNSNSSIKLTNNVKITGHNPLKISKTLTEHNILNKIQKTPKNSKMSFLSSISSVQKTNYNSSAKTQKIIPFESNSNLKILSNFSFFKGAKAKTQSELKQRKYLNFNGSGNSNNNNYNNPYNNQNFNFEKNVKQKLLDRMNNAMKNNWNYLYPNQENESKKILIQNISEIIQTPNKDNYCDYSNSGNKGKNDSDLKEYFQKDYKKFPNSNKTGIGNDEEDFFE